MRMHAAIMAVMAITSTAKAVTNPLAGSGAGRGSAYTDEERRELDELETRVHEFEQKAIEYRAATRRLIEQKYNAQRQAVFQAYEDIIVQLEKDQRAKREDAVARFEAFIKEYPSEARYTPDAMFRLAELYFEQSYDVYFRQRQAYDKALEAWTQGSGAEPAEPQLHYEPTIAMMQRLLTQFPSYRLVDGAYYLLGYCLTEQGEEDRATVVYEELVSRFPKSKFAPEVWTRIGEYYFNSNELEKALRAYSNVLGEVDSPYYDKALYKLAWTHYRLADPDRAPQEYQAAVDTFVRLLDFNVQTKREGNERGGDLKEESIQYIAISYADEQWGGLEKAVLYFQSIGGRPYERDVYRALGDVYFDQTRFAEAIRVYGLVQQRYPNDPTAPDVQDKIIAAYERDRNFEGAAGARERMTTLFTESGQWAAANKNDGAALKNAKRLTETSLYGAALFYHRQAQVAREANKVNQATTAYRRAAAAYGEYLKRFPADKQAYDLMFYHAETLYYSQQFALAATEYEKVRDSNLDNKYLELAAYNAILSYERQVQVAESRGELAKVKVQKSTERDPTKPITEQPIPKLKLEVIEASDKFAGAVPNSAETPKVLYKAAEIYFTYDHFDEARRRFQALLEAYPQHQVAEYSANLIIESYLAEKNYAAVEKFSSGLLARAATPGVQRGFKGDLVKYKAGAMFKIAEDLQAAGQSEKAAEEYLRILNEHPDNQFADSALNNAAVAYESSRRYESASKLYERLVHDYPKSPLADDALFRVGLNAERFFDFDKATRSYLKLVDDYPKSERRADAIYNAALSLENTQSYEAAAKQYQRYCELFPKRDDAPSVCFRAGSVYEKMGEPQKVIGTYTAFTKRYKGSAKDTDRVVEADLKIAKAYEKLRKPKDAEQSYKNAVADFKKNPSDAAAPYGAEAQFQLVERDFEKFRAVSVTGNSAQQKAAIVRKAKMLKDVEASYKQVLGFKQVDWTMASLFRIGRLYQSFAESVIQAPCPIEVKRSAKRVGGTEDEVCEEYRALLEEQAGTIEDKAVAAYETAITRARELQVANTWTKQTLVALNKLRRAQWPLQKDAKTYVDNRALATPPVALADGRTARPSPDRPKEEEKAQ